MKRWLKRTGIAVVVSLVITTLIGVVNRVIKVNVGMKDLQAVIGELDRTEVTWRWEDFDTARRKALPAEINAAELAVKLYDFDPKDRPAQPDAFFLMSRISDNTVQTPPQRLDTEDRNVLQWSLAAIAPQVQHMDKIRQARASYYHVELTPDWISSKVPHLAIQRRVHTILHAQRLVDIDAQRNALVQASLLDQMKLIGLMGDEPGVIAQLIRIAGGMIARNDLERWLAQTEVDDATLAELQAAFAREATFPYFTTALRGERAGLNHLFTHFDEIPEGTLPGGKNVLEQFGAWKFRAIVPQNHAATLRFLTDCLTADQKPEWERLDALRAVPRPPDEKDWVLANMLLTDVNKIMSASLRQIAQMRCAVVALACERFRLKNQRWPKNLEELIPNELEVTPLDPFTGMPLLLHPNDDGLTIYSVGPDGQNDNGMLYRGVGDLNKGYDIGMRLWNPKARRQPALERPAEPLKIAPRMIDETIGEDS